MRTNLTWTTNDEIDFLSNLYFNNRVAFNRYAYVIRQGLRRWDFHINVPAIQAHITTLTKGSN